MRSWFTVGVYTSLAVSLNKLFHSHGEEGSSFFLVAVPADFSQRETFINRMSKRELSNNFQAPQFINLSCLNFFFLWGFFFLFLTQLPCTSLLYSALFVLQLCRSTALLPAAVPLLPWVPKAVGRELRYLEGCKKNRCAALPPSERASWSLKTILLASASLCQVILAKLVLDCACCSYLL